LLVVAVTWSVLLHLAAMLTWSLPPNWSLLPFPVLQLSAYLIFHGAFAPNLLAWSGLPTIVAVLILVLLALAAIIVNGGKRSLPYIAIATLIFAIALARAAPTETSDTARAFEPFLTYMGRGR
jgi:hypothetical protein